MEEDKIINKRKEKVLSFFKKDIKWVFYAILGFIIFLSTYIRTRPMKISSVTGKPGLWDLARDHWTLGPDLDPFLFLRWAKEIVANGSLMAHDTMRYVPLGYETKAELLFHPYLIAWIHKFLSVFGLSSSIEYSAVIYPVILFGLTVIAFFLLVRKIFLKRLGYKRASIISLLSCLFLVILPSLLPRTIAGIPEKESAAFLFLFLSLYLFLCAWFGKTRKSRIGYSILSGMATAAMALIWGGYGYIFLIIGLSIFIAFILGKVSKERAIVYSSWIISSFAFMMPFSTRYYPKEIVLNTILLPSLLVFATIIFHLAISRTKLFNYYKRGRLSKIPPQIISFILTAVILLILVTIVFGFGFIGTKINDVVINLVSPAQSRLIKTVAENRQPYFSEWANNFGPFFLNIPVVFWLFFVGSVYLFSHLMSVFTKKERFFLTISYLYFLIAIIFSRYSSNGLLNGTNPISLLFYSSGFIVLIGSIGYYYTRYFLEGRSDKLKSLDFGIILLMAYFFLGIISARGAIRLVMILVAPASIILSYFVVVITDKATKKKNNLVYWFISLVLIVLVLFAAFMPGKGLFYVSVSHASVQIPSPYTHQWQYSMSWVRENTSEDAVFGHWWDYGYWLQGIGERATMLDGGNSVGYWNYLMGRHVLTGETEKEAMDVLYGHKVSHFLIDSTDIGKYSAYSSIGSDENSDRFSWIGTYFLNEQAIQETKNNTAYIYEGGINLDEDILIEVDGKELFLPSQRAGVYALVVYQDSDGNYLRPEAVIIYNNQQYRVGLRYLYVNNELIDFGSLGKKGIDSGAYLFPKLENTGRMNPVGVSFYLSEKNLRALWVRLYLLQEGENFKLVHKQPSFIHKEFLIPNNIEAGDFVYFQGGVQGPIKIWEIEYPQDQKIHEVYVQRNFPEEISHRA